MSSASKRTSGLKPILLYDHLPGILAGYPAVLFAILAILSLPYFSEKGTVVPDESRINQQMLFWVGLSVSLIWYIAFRFNLPKNRFWLMFGLFGTFIGIPVVLELTGYIRPFRFLGDWLGSLKPEVNTGVWLVMAIVFGIIWLGNFIWSRTHMRVRIDESGLTLNQLGGKGERFELIGLKTENEPLDYLELFVAGVGSLALKTRMNKPIFKMNRVIGLYRIPWFPFMRGKLSRIDEMLSFQGKVYSVEAQEGVDAAEMADSAGEDELFEGDNELAGESEFSDESIRSESPDSEMR